MHRRAAADIDAADSAGDSARRRTHRPDTTVTCRAADAEPIPLTLFTACQQQLPRPLKEAAGDPVPLLRS
jgi:hypothetical protein